MKITFIVDFLFSDRAGTENQVMKLVRGLAQRHQVELIVLRPSVWLTAHQASLPCAVTVFQLGSVTRPGFWGGLMALRRHLRQTSPDVVHTFFPAANIFGVLAAHRAGVPTIVASRRDYGHWMTPRYLKATRFANRYLHGIITNSQQVKELTVRVEGMPAERIAVIANGVLVDALRRPTRDLALKAQLGIPADAIVIGLVANFRPIKRHDTLLNAVARLLPERPDLHVLFVGGDNKDEPAKDSVLAYAEGIGLQNRVHCGRADGNIADFLSILDIGVNCSESEGLSNAIVEYMCAGVPCVISDGGGNRDLVDHERTGLLFRVGDDAGMAQQLLRMLDDEALRSRCVDDALAMVRHRMELDAVLRMFEQQYLSFSEAARGSQPLDARQAAKQVVRRVMRTSTATSLARRAIPRRSVAVMMYHDIGADDADLDVWQLVRESDFLRQVESLRRRFDLVSLDDAAHRMSDRQFDGKPMAVLTFDDGDAGNFERLLPIVEREGLPVTIYVATQHVQEGRGFWFDRIVNCLQTPCVIDLDLRDFNLGTHQFNQDRGSANWARIQRLLQSIKSLPLTQCEELADVVAQRVSGPARRALSPMTVDQVAEVARSRHVTLGSHSHGHEVMTLLDDDEIRRSVETSMKLLQDWTGRRPRHFAFPGGFHDARAEAVIRNMGFTTAMGGGVGLWREDSSLFALPRLHVGRYDGRDQFDIQLDWSGLLHRRQAGMRTLGWVLPALSYAFTDLP